MKTEQEIRQMVNTCNMYRNCAGCPYNPEDISRFIGDRWKGGCPNYDKKLVYAMGKGYGDVSEYKAEIERLRQEVRDTDKMARNTIEQYKNNYDNAFERLKAQEREIERLKAEVKQAQIDVLNKVMTYINNKIENDYGDMSDSVEYLTINIDEFDDFTDELIKEVGK